MRKTAKCILKSSQQAKDLGGYYALFTSEKMQAQSGPTTCPKLSSWGRAGTKKSESVKATPFPLPHMLLILYRINAGRCHEFVDHRKGTPLSNQLSILISQVLAKERIKTQFTLWASVEGTIADSQIRVDQASIHLCDFRKMCRCQRCSQMSKPLMNVRWSDYHHALHIGQFLTCPLLLSYPLAFSRIWLVCREGITKASEILV